MSRPTETGHSARFKRVHALGKDTLRRRIFEWQQRYCTDATTLENESDGTERLVTGPAIKLELLDLHRQYVSTVLERQRRPRRQVAAVAAVAVPQLTQDQQWANALPTPLAITRLSTKRDLAVALAAARSLLYTAKPNGAGLVRPAVPVQGDGVRGWNESVGGGDSRAHEALGHPFWMRGLAETKREEERS